MVEAGLVATPRTRGSTVRVSPSWPTGQGYPAHAGIDPQGVYFFWRKHRLPRARGDRPMSPLPLGVEITATPRTRGSTPSPDPLGHGPRGYPAHAGIDPLRVGAGECPRGLPRARGDRPGAFGNLLRFMGATPRTRGSTLVENVD